jgi:hypothetical protein
VNRSLNFDGRATITIDGKPPDVNGGILGVDGRGYCSSPPCFPA